jgi:hypothetical protein
MFLFVIIVSHCQMQESIPVTQLVRETAAVMQEFTQSGCVCILVLLVAIARS